MISSFSNNIDKCIGYICYPESVNKNKYISLLKAWSLDNRNELCYVFEDVYNYNSSTKRKGFSIMIDYLKNDMNMLNKSISNVVIVNGIHIDHNDNDSFNLMMISLNMLNYNVVLLAQSYELIEDECRLFDIQINNSVINVRIDKSIINSYVDNPIKHRHDRILGYGAGINKFNIDKNESEIVISIFKMYIRFQNLKHICNYLKDNKIVSYLGIEYNSTMIKKILENKHYINNISPIISKELFEHVQSLRSINKLSYKNRHINLKR